MFQIDPNNNQNIKKIAKIVKKIQIKLQKMKVLNRVMILKVNNKILENEIEIEIEKDKTDKPEKPD